MKNSLFRGKKKSWYGGSLAILALFCAFACLPEPILAQEKYPAKFINFMIGYPGGGTTDVCARPLVTAASKILGQPIVVLNKPGGASAVAMASLRLLRKPWKTRTSSG